MDNIHNYDDKRQSIIESDFQKKLENFWLNDETLNQDNSNFNILNSTDLISNQRNFYSPLMENKINREKRKTSPSPISKKLTNNPNSFVIGKNLFFDEISEKIERNKQQGIKLVCKHKNINEKLYPSNDGSLMFYWYDAHEENTVKGDPLVILFGKIFIKEKNKFESISIVMKNLYKKVYIIPKIEKLNEQNILENVKVEFEKLNQTKFSFIKKGIYKTKYKKYCLEMPIPYNEYPLLKFSYPAEYPNIPSNITSGVYFDYVFNKNNHLLENIFLSRKIKGPCWIKLKKYEAQEINQTWSKYEVICNDYKDLCVNEENGHLPIPYLNILSFSTKSKKVNINNRFNKEIIAISGIVYDYDLEKGNNSIKSSFILIKENDNYVKEEISNMELENNTKKVTYCQSEVILLNKFFSNLLIYDPDIIISHNLYKENLDDIISCVNLLKINENWSKLGRIRRSMCPKFLSGKDLNNNIFQMRFFSAGRIICDTVVSLQEILKETNFELPYLANRYEIQNSLKSEDIAFFLENNNLIDIGNQALEEARVSFELMNKFSILQLNKQLSDISGSLWVKSLQNSRVDRCEFLLLHEFKKNKFILPDKSYHYTFENSEELNNETQEEKMKFKIKNYSGGLVLDPKTGFYDQIIILLDFNSLYPSIIQQYNICFTTVERKPTQQFFENRRFSNNQIGNSYEITEEEDNIDLNIIRKTESKAILPQIIESLVMQRNQIKEGMKKEKDNFKKEMLNIKQIALKLSANSLYGFLGYKYSRFYSKTIAALITKIGREILKETVNIVKQIPKSMDNCALDIIYGDTDSIMVNTLTNDLKRSLEIGEIIKNKINNKEKAIKIEIDYVFKNILLLKKKKYAGLKYENYNELKNCNFIGEPVFKKELKGLEIVRRDWCILSKQVGMYVLDLLLTSKRPKEDIINLIYDYLKQINNEMNEGKMNNDMYIISKQLVKNIEDYDNINLLPHIKVARRMRENGDLSINCGTIINYVICKNKNEIKKTKKVSDKAYHIKELKHNKNLEIDISWYKENQLLLSVNRLLKHIKEISTERLVECLGLDKNRYILKEVSNHELMVNEVELIDNINTVIIMYTRLGVVIKCENCNYVIRVMKIDESNDNLKEVLYCNSCEKELGNMIKLLNNMILNLKKYLSKYFYGLRKCSKCKDTTRLFLKKKCTDLTCSRGKYKKVYSENDISNDICFVNKLFEFDSKMDERNLLKKYENDLNVIKNIALGILNEKIEFNKIDLTSLFSFLKK